MILRLLGVSVAILFVHAVASGQPGTVEVVSFRERLVESVPISGGGIRVGVVTGGGGAPVDPRRFYAHVPAEAAGTLCVEIVSQDGRYQAEIEYRLPRPGRGATPLMLPLPTLHSRELRRYPAAQLAILAHLSARCGGAVENYLVAGWSTEARPWDFVLLLNTPDPARVVISGGPAGQQIVACVAARGAGSVAFNQSCPVSIAPSWDRVELAVQRARRSVPPVRLSVLLP